MVAVSCDCEEFTLQIKYRGLLKGKVQKSTAEMGSKKLAIWEVSVSRHQLSKIVPL